MTRYMIELTHDHVTGLWGALPIVKSEEDGSGPTEIPATPFAHEGKLYLLVSGLERTLEADTEPASVAAH